MLKIRASDYWTVLPAIVAHISELLNNRASTVEELYQRLLKNCASDCWRIMPVTVEESCPTVQNYGQQSMARLISSRWHDFSTVTGTILQQSPAWFFNIVPCTRNTTHDPNRIMCRIPGKIRYALIILFIDMAISLRESYVNHSLCRSVFQQKSALFVLQINWLVSLW